jgi:hypothetical protein
LQWTKPLALAIGDKAGQADSPSEPRHDSSRVHRYVNDSFQLFWLTSCRDDIIMESVKYKKWSHTTSLVCVMLKLLVNSAIRFGQIYAVFFAGAQIA